MCMGHQVTRTDSFPGNDPVISGIMTKNLGIGSCQDAASMATVPAGPVRRRWVWEIDTIFKCPLVGLCIDLAEQRQILKKTGQVFKDMTPFDIHELFVASMETDNGLSRRIDRLLEKKYSKLTAGCHAQSDKEFLVRWKMAFDSGEYRAEFWAAVTRPDLSDVSKKQIFGTIHMAMHVQGETFGRMKMQLAALGDRVKIQDQIGRASCRERV